LQARVHVLPLASFPFLVFCVSFSFFIIIIGADTVLLMLLLLRVLFSPSPFVCVCVRVVGGGCFPFSLKRRHRSDVRRLPYVLVASLVVDALFFFSSVMSLVDLMASSFFLFLSFCSLQKKKR
jgi:hypothetical protein